MSYGVGLWKAQTDAWQATAQALEAGVNKLDPHGAVLDSTIVTPHAIGNSQTTTSVKELLGRTKGALKDIENIDRKTVFQLSLDWLGNFVRMPTRFIGATDEFFKQMNYRAEVYSNAYIEAMEKAGRNADTSVISKIAEGKIDETFDAMGRGLDERGLLQGRSSTFTSELQAGISKSLQAFVSRHPTMRLLMPFVRTPINILDDIVLRTPGLQFIKRDFREAFKNTTDPFVRADAYGRFATGAALTGTGVYWAMNGRITGKGPGDPNQRKNWLDAGNQPYSFKIGDEYFSYERLEPFGSMIGVMADLAATMGWVQDPQTNMKASDQEWDEVAFAVMASVANNITNKTYLRGLTEVMAFITNPEEGDRRRIWQRRFASYVPNALAQANPDETMRTARGLMDSFMQRIPGLSDNLAPRRNVFGEPIQYPDSLGPSFMSPIKRSKLVDDDVKNELARLSDGFGPPAPTLGPKDEIDLRDFENARGQDAHDRYQELHLEVRIGGKSMHQVLDKLIKSKAYKEAGTPDFENRQARLIRNVIGSFRSVAFKRLQGEFPELRQELTRVRLESRVGPARASEILSQLSQF
jgi:hypothetical protein